MNLFQFGWLGCLARAYFHIYFNKQCRVGTRKHMLGVHTHCISAPKCSSSWGRYRRNANKRALHFFKKEEIGGLGVLCRWAGLRFFGFEKLWVTCQKQLILNSHSGKEGVSRGLQPLTRLALVGSDLCVGGQQWTFCANWDSHASVWFSSSRPRSL